MFFGDLPEGECVSGGEVYRPEDLGFLQNLLDEILADLRKRDGALLDPSSEADLKLRLAVALFECATPDVRDALRLKRLALERVASSVAADHRSENEPDLRRRG